jgi:RND family efflux transporter MFP subunit
MKKFIFTVFILAGLGVLGWQIYVKASAQKDFRHQRRSVPVAVEVAAVDKTTIQEVGNFTGSLYPVYEFVVAPKIAGRLEKMLVYIGDRVQSGQLLAVLDDEEYHQQVSEAKAELEVAQANLLERKTALENAKREYDRTVALRQKKIASESQLDAADSEYKAQQAKLKVAFAQVSQMEAALKMADVRLSYTKIRVPENNIHGYRVVGERFVDEGTMLSANQPIATILDISKLIGAIYVIERDYPKIKQGFEADITTDAFPGQAFKGKVVRIAPMLKEKSREARIEIEVPNPEKLLKPGMFVRVQIQFDQHENATVVPTGALVKRDGTEGIFLADLGAKKATFVPVTVGIINGDQTEIINPPIEGSVVTLGQHLLENGSTIVLPEAKAAGPSQKSSDTPGVKKGKIPKTGEQS